MLHCPTFCAIQHRRPYCRPIKFKHCINLVEVHESIGHLEKLVVLNLEGCKNLMKLPILRSIQDLILSGCSKLEMKKLNLVSAKSWYSVWSWVSPRKNTELSSFSLASLPLSLTSLRLDCCNLSEISSALTMLSSLERLNLRYNPITSLPESMNNLVKLQTLDVSGCRNLTMLPELPRSLTSLRLAWCNISEIPSALTMLSSLEYLSLDKNPITSLPESMNNLVRLQTLKVPSFRNLTMRPKLPRSLKQLDGKGCTSLKRITNLPKLAVSRDFWFSHILLDPNLWYCGKRVDVKSMLDTLTLDSDLSDLFDLEPKGGIEVQGNYFESLGVKGTFECGIFSIFVHESKIPDRFNYRSMGNTVLSIIVPSHLNLKIVGLNACILYARQSERSLELGRGHDHHSLELRNETKGLKWKCSAEWEGMNEDMLWLSRWIMGNNELGCGEKVSFAITEQCGFLAEIGVQFVYKQQNKDTEDVPLSSEDTTIQRERSTWGGTIRFIEITRPGV